MRWTARSCSGRASDAATNKTSPTPPAAIELLGTYSGYRALEPEQQTGLLACISQLIDQNYGGTITKRYLYELRVAHKRPPL